MKTKILFLLCLLSALCPVLLLGQTAAVPAEAGTPNAAVPADAGWPELVAILGAIVILARVIVKLTPTPKDDTLLATAITWLKHIGLHLGCILAAACLLAGCATHPTTVQVAADQDHNITGSVTTDVTTNVTVGVTGSGNPDTGDWQAGLVVTFKDAPPAKEVSDYLVAAGWVQRLGNEFVLIGKADTALKQQALTYALRSGANLRALFKSELKYSKVGTTPRAVPTTSTAGFTFLDVDGQRVTLMLTQEGASTTTTPTGNDPFEKLTARGQEVKAAVAARVARLAAERPADLRLYATAYYQAALVGLETGSLTIQQILTAQTGQGVDAQLQAVIGTAAPADLTQTCLGIAAAAQDALAAVGADVVAKAKK